MTALTSAPSRWSIDLNSLAAGLPALDPQPPPSVRRAAPIATAESQRLLPYLPIELVASILARADRSTLVTATRVCWDWLREASPCLYESVTIDRHGSFEELFQQRDSPVSPALERYLSLHQIRHLTLLVQPSTPPSSSRLALSSSPPPHPLRLKSLSVSLAYGGAIGYAPFFALVRPEEVSFRPRFNRSSKFDFETEQRSWEVITAEWMRGGRLKRVRFVGCNLTCRMRAPSERDGDDEAERPLIERFVALPVGRPTRPVVVDGEAATADVQQEPSIEEEPPMEVIYDLTTLPPLTIPFYRHFLVQRSIDGVFSVPGLKPAEAFDGLQPTTDTRGVRVVVRRQQEADWIKEGLALIRSDERALVTVEVPEAAAAAPGDKQNGGNGGSGGKGVSGGLGGVLIRSV